MAVAIFLDSVPEKGWDTAIFMDSVFVTEKGWDPAIFMELCVCAREGMELLLYSLFML